MPETVLPAAGAVTATVGAVVSAIVKLAPDVAEFQLWPAAVAGGHSDPSPPWSPALGPPTCSSVPFPTRPVHPATAA